LLIPDPDPTIAPSRIRIPDLGGKKAPDPGFGSATLAVILKYPLKSTKFSFKIIIVSCRELEVEHPAAKLMILGSQMQEVEVGDATNLVIIFAGALLKEAEDLLR
jgi:hypothetical protein